VVFLNTIYIKKWVFFEGGGVIFVFFVNQKSAILAKNAVFSPF
jgi:hypothetical protein